MGLTEALGDAFKVADAVDEAEREAKACRREGLSCDARMVCELRSVDPSRSVAERNVWTMAASILAVRHFRVAVHDGVGWGPAEKAEYRLASDAVMRKRRIVAEQAAAGFSAEYRIEEDGPNGWELAGFMRGAE